MNWEAAAALAAWTVIIGGILLWSVRGIVRDEVAKINGTYKRTAEYVVRDAEIERRLETVESRLESRRAKA